MGSNIHYSEMIRSCYCFLFWPFGFIALKT